MLDVNFPDTGCRSDRALYRRWKRRGKRGPKSPAHALIASGRPANCQGSYYEDHVTHISRAQAGGLLSYGTGSLPVDAHAASASSLSASSGAPPPPSHAGRSSPGWAEKGFSRTLRTLWTCKERGSEDR